MHGWKIRQHQKSSSISIQTFSPLPPVRLQSTSDRFSQTDISLPLCVDPCTLTHIYTDRTHRYIKRCTHYMYALSRCVCLSLYISISLYLYVYLSLCMSVYMRVYLYVYQSLCISISMYVYLYVCISMYTCACLYVCLSLGLSICMAVCLLSFSVLSVLVGCVCVAQDRSPG